MYPGIFFFSRSSLIFDFIILVLFILIPVVFWSIHQARQGRYERHMLAQKWVTFALMMAVFVFEVDMRVWGWRHLAEPSPYYATILFPVLYSHIFCSLVTLLLWVRTLWLARVMDPREFPLSHRGLARSAVYGLCLTAVSGFVFYWMAFVAL